jgi:hypothetical protein
MAMRHYLLPIALLALSSVAAAQNVVYLCVDENGKRFFSNTGENAGCKKVTLPPEKSQKKEAVKGRVNIGMTKDQVVTAGWGSPRDVTKTTTAQGLTEHWFYGEGNTLTFENGVLTKIEN